MDIVHPMRYTVDLNDGLVQKPMETRLMKGDKKANCVIVEIKNGEDSVTLSGVTATGSFIRPADDAAILLKGSISGSVVTVELVDKCYEASGECQIDVELTAGEVKRTILSITGDVIKKGSGAYVDVSGVIPSLDDIVAQYATMQEVTLVTINAAGTATAAAQNAQNKADRADRAATLAGDASSEALAQADKIQKMTVSAQAADAAGARISERDGGKHIDFDLPPGPTPQITFTVSTGAPGTQVEISQGGTALRPEIHLTIPRGDTGAVDGVDYYAGTPSALGAASPGTANGLARGDHVHPMPTANDVGALEKDGTAADSAKLGGKATEYYIQPRNLLDNIDFTNPVNQRGQTSYTGGVYTIDRWYLSADNGTASIDDNGVTLFRNAGNGYTFLQYVEKLDTSKVYTFAVKDASGNVYLICSTPNERKETEMPFGTIIAQTLPDTMSAFGVTLNSGVTITLVWAALYEGEYTAETLPPYVPKGYAAELAECQRYYRQTHAPGDYRSFATAIVARASNKNWTSSVNFEQPMRITPTVTIYSPIDGAIGKIADWSTETNVNAEVSVFASKTGFLLNAPSAFDSENAYYYQYTASADL